MYVKHFPFFKLVFACVQFFRSHARFFSFRLRNTLLFLASFLRCGGFSFYLVCVSSSEVQMFYHLLTEPWSDSCGNMIQISLAIDQGRDVVKYLYTS